MASHFPSIALLVLSIFNFALVFALPELVLEDGYTVTTVIDGYKVGINPHSVLFRSGPSDLIVLDSFNSVFYTVSFPLSSESVINRLAGSSNGFSDGDSGSAKFNNPRSFAVDLKGNIYVADRKNHAIRKISASGVSTIAGGFYNGRYGPNVPGNHDGPAQTATFSSDFEVTFVAKECALLVSDHGNRLIRQINLKPEDCVSQSNSVGAVSVWTIGMPLLGLLLGLVIGIAIRPYVIRSQGFSSNHCHEIWKRCQINLGRRIRILCFGIRSVVASSLIFSLPKRLFWMSLSQLSLMFRINSVEPSNVCASLLDTDDFATGEITKSDKYANQLKDLISFDGNFELSNSTDKELDQGYDNQVESEVLSRYGGRVDNMMYTNIMDFTKGSKETTPLEGSLVGTLGLVKRR